MQTPANRLTSLVIGLAPILGSFWCLNLALGADYLSPSDVVLPPERASQETLEQSVSTANLRLAGLDFYPRASVAAMYDDNILISANDPLRDVEWTVAPGFTLAAGDLSLYLPGSITLGQIRNLLLYSLLEDTSKPRRYLGLDYSPAFNFYTDHNQYDNIDHVAGFTAGYAFARLAIGLDQDFSRLDVKENEIAGRITQARYDTRLQLRYDLTDRSYLEMDGHYSRVDYEEDVFQGYQELLNENWFNRQVGARLEAGLGLGFGLVYPEENADQVFQRALVRGLYRLSGKLDLRASAGIEWRQYDDAIDDTFNPVVSFSSIYRPRASTTITVEVHRRETPSVGSDYNYTTIGASAGIRQQILGELYVELAGTYDNVDYVLLRPGVSNNRTDDYISVRANLEYEFNSHLKATLFYSRRQDDSTLSQFSYENNMVGIRVSWRY